jgi:hypothetical protein
VVCEFGAIFGGFSKVFSELANHLLKQGGLPNSASEIMQNISQNLGTILYQALAEY